MDSSAKGDGHSSLGSTDHGPAGFHDIATERDQAHTADVTTSDGHVVYNERVSENKTDGDVDAWVKVQHFVSETKHTLLSSNHDRLSTGSVVGEFVQWQERGPAGFVFGQPANGPGCVLVGVNHD